MTAARTRFPTAGVFILMDAVIYSCSGRGKGVEMGMCRMVTVENTLFWTNCWVFCHNRQMLNSVQFGQ